MKTLIELLSSAIHRRQGLTWATASVWPTSADRARHAERQATVQDEWHELEMMFDGAQSNGSP